MKAIEPFGLLVLRAYANAIIVVWDETVAWLDKKRLLKSKELQELGMVRFEFDLLLNASRQFLPSKMVAVLAGMGIGMFW